LQNLKQELLDDIRSKLGSNKISLEIGLLKTEIQAKAYKPGDVFKSMAEKNPSLLELKKRFDLEIDY
jgi:DNA polymerase-3 subunit gamma/tau